MTIYNPEQFAHYRLLREMLVEARVAKNWLQKELAIRLRKHQSYVSKFEAGDRKLGPIELLHVIEVMELDEIKFLKEFRKRVVSFNASTETEALQEVAKREAATQDAYASIKALMREHNIKTVTSSDLDSPPARKKKPTLK